MKRENYIEFDVNGVPLEGVNLVEASAGTGKTFSIGILVLRLLLEKDVGIDRVLLVTFTNNAVAELEERIRRFVRQAHDYAVYGKNVESYIVDVVEKAVAHRGEEEVRQKLKDAVLFLDQLSVMTIHGFCKQCLSNQAFETGQLFGLELRTDVKDIYELYVRGFWRTHINTLPPAIFRELRDAGFDMRAIMTLLEKHYAGKKYPGFDDTKQYQIMSGEGDSEFGKILAAIEKCRKEFNKCLEEQRDSLRPAMEANSYAKKYIDDLHSADLMWKFITDKSDTNYVEKIFGTSLLPHCREYKRLEEQLSSFMAELINNIYCLALSDIPRKVLGHIQAAGIVSFDGLIRNLHAAITGDNKDVVIEELRHRYDAVFVDEFQDTDKLQYEIFKNAFHDDRTVLFYIGDPKQSIYAFRQADINTYLGSYRDVDRVYTMNTNYRSTPRLVQALNRFFLPTEEFDTFHFGDADSAIRYMKVEAAGGLEKDLFYDAEKHHPIVIEKGSAYPEIKESVARKIFELLNDEKYTIQAGDEKRRIRPSDIGVLVANNSFGKDIKELLNKRNIPAIIMNDDKIMQSAEATALFHVLKAMHNPAIENVNAALVNRFTGKSASEVISLKGDALVELFRNYKAKWESGGVNQALASYMADFGVKNHLIDPNTENGLRIISNLEQLRELLVKTEYLQRMAPDDLMDWMKCAKDQELVEEDEGVIRLESDADSVTIITIHRSKGLEYNIVFSPQTDLPLRDPSSDAFVEVYEDGEYVLVPQPEMTEDRILAYEKQARQEKRRLLYVALTRAVCACFIYHSERMANSSTVQPFLSSLTDDELIQMKTYNAAEQLGLQRYSGAGEDRAVPEMLVNDFALPDPYWQFMSYSALAADGLPPSVSARLTEFSGYDSFVFKTLRRGSITGNMLHEIFEKIDFRDSEKQVYPITVAIDRYAASGREVYAEYLPQLVSHVLNAVISTGETSFRLSDIASEKRLQELEFDFSVKNFSTIALTDICREANIPVAIKNRSELCGIMNGFIDLFFEHQGRYYILDWKSNFLGNDIADYAGDSLQDAMAYNNYHLQYLIYTLALTKYLRQRLDDFNYADHFGGVMYCFIRGMRKNGREGVFFTKPDYQLISRMEEMLSDEKGVFV